jgi:tetratricopeptide (TPR) repeat protein
MNEAAMASAYKVAEAEGRLTSLLPLLNEALEINPRSVMHLNWLAVVRESAGNMNGAETALRRVLEIDPDHGGAMANLGAFYGRHGRADDAVPLLQRALRIEPANQEARINLGTALARLGRADEAAAEFERAVEGGSRDVGVYNALARIHGERGNLPAAAGWLRRSLEIDPDQQQIRELLGSIEAAEKPAGQ